MPTKNPRINVALEKPVYRLIEKIAKGKGISMSMVTRDLVRDALEIHEDAFLVEFAESRDATLNSKDTLSHSEVWQ